MTEPKELWQTSKSLGLPNKKNSPWNIIMFKKQK